MTIQALIIWLVIGAVAGWLAGQIMKGYGFGLIGNIVVGIVGAFIAGWLLPRIGFVLIGGVVAEIINAVIGQDDFVTPHYLFKPCSSRNRWPYYGRDSPLGKSWQGVKSGHCLEPLIDLGLTSVRPFFCCLSLDISLMSVPTHAQMVIVRTFVSAPALLTNQNGQKPDGKQFRRRGKY
jgi:uncharacterized membrane protein YeaQ/YmgE (transglycosylase-associated protein family)